MSHLGECFHVNFNVFNMDKMIKFYEEGFGFKKESEVTHDCKVPLKKMKIAYMTTQLQGLKIEFIECIEPETKKVNIPGPGACEQGYNHLCIPVEDIDKTHEVLKKLGMKMECGVLDYKHAGLKFFYGRDIEGNLIEVIQKSE